MSQTDWVVVTSAHNRSIYGTPATLDEVIGAVRQQIRDPEYLLFLLGWAAMQLESVIDLDEYCTRLQAARPRRGNREPITGEPMSDYQDGPREDG